ncbi:helix-turn-helix transcriptional regulator [Neobacillus novalis]|uniref:Helix-turn-helix transcriptional regulator n=1 Tax=Neobacillus novalis TaxID=220687 RepID=A0AA95MRZ0_9BACI|nr:helix-turn-helix transcriptional regulator [Neobacillus novalis]WHY86226.1 helix-turn-helix transcriptional regulator [Neobacillus novalis]
MSKEISYTIEEVSQLLKVSKLTIYDLIKKGELPVFRVGRQMRMDAADLDRYIKNQKSAQMPASAVPAPESHRTEMRESHNVVISGQDIVLDILGKQIEKCSPYKSLRSYSGSLNSLISLYNGDCDIVSLHMFDGDTGEYNLPYVKRILTGNRYIVLNLVARKAGLYVKKGNPLNLTSWTDLSQPHITMINREKGSGARILLDEQLRIHNLASKSIIGYEHEETNHLSVASVVATGKADVGVGIEKAAKMVGIDFVPLIIERYDLVLLKTPENETLIRIVKEILSSSLFQTEISSLGDYDQSQTGSVIYETF